MQANVSVLGVSACGSGGRAALSGRYELREALDRLLAGAPCAYAMADARTVRIAVAPKAPPHVEPLTPPPSLVAELVVTATKRPASLQRLAAGVSAISREQLALTGSADVGQTIGQVAGVASTNLGPGRDKLLIRGLSDGAFTGRARSTVGTYLDDTPINYNAPDPDLRLVDVDRIEVVRGPQGALYGSGAVAGVYRIVTSRPDLNAYEGGGMAEAASTDGGDMSYSAEGYLSVPVVKDRAAVRVVAYQDQVGGYLDDVNLSEANVDRTRRSGGRLAVALQATPRWRIDLAATAQKLRSSDAQYVTRAADAPRPMRSTHVRETHGNDFGHGAVRVQGDLGWAGLTSSTALVRHTFTSQYDASAGAREAFNLPPNSLVTYAESARINMLVEDLVLRSLSGGDVDWLIGVYAAKTREQTPARAATASTAGGATALYAEDRTDRRRDLAMYGEVNWRFAPDWTATLGGRRFQSRVRTASNITGILPTQPRGFDEGRTFEGFSPKIAVQREFANGDLAYALISEGYRPGGFNSAGLLKPREERATFKSDKMRNYELGVKLRRFDQRLTVRASAYYDVWRDIQTDQYRPSGLSYTANVADARIRGLEAEAAYDWDFGLTVQANGLVQRSSTFDANPTFANVVAVPSAKVANALPGVPDLSGGVLATYERPLTGGFTLRLAGEASYVGRSAISFDTGQAVQMDGFVRARLAAEIGTARWRAAVFVNNPQDSSKDTFAYGNPFSFGAYQQLLTPQRPRTFGARLSATF